jgi:hypothetical protein
MGHAEAAVRPQNRVRKGHTVCSDEVMDIPRPFVIRESTHRIHDPLTLASCLGATWIGDGVFGTIDLLDRAQADHLVVREHLGWGVFALMAR